MAEASNGSTARTDKRWGERILSWLGTICFVLSALIAWILIWFGPEADPPAGGGPGGKFIGVIIFSLPFWGFLAVGYWVAVVRGGLDWIGRGRIVQHLLAFGAATGGVVSIALCSMLFPEPIDQTPWVMIPFRGWGLYGVPPLVIGAGVIAASPRWRAALPERLVRGLQIAVGVLVLIVAVGLSVEQFVSEMRASNQRLIQAAHDEQRWEQQRAAEVETADALWDFGVLLGRSGVFESKPTREVALAKIRSHPNLTRELSSRLRNEWRGEAMTFLAWNDVPDPAALAEPVRDSIFLLADDVRQQFRDAHHLWNESFDDMAKRVLAVADRYGGYGVDLVPAVRAFRSALDEPRAQKIVPTARKPLDDWLARAQKTDGPLR